MAARALVTLALALIGCDRAPGAVHLRAPGVAGELVVDQEHRGPVQAEQTIQLPPGEHRIAIWRGPSEIVASVVEVRSRMVVEVAVDPALLPEAVAEREAAERAAAEAAARAEAEARAARADADRRAALAALEEASRTEEVARAVEEERQVPRHAQGLLAVLLERTSELSRICRAHVHERTQLLLRVHVSGAGRVDRASVGDAHTAAGQCVLHEARSWRFPPTREGSEIQLPVVLSP